MSEKPEIDFPGGEAPTELVIDDIVVGTGAEAVPGATVPSGLDVQANEPLVFVVDLVSVP